MNTRPSVCVVAPSYNHEQFIEQCLESVIAQTADCDIDIIVIDDASSDGTARIARQLLRSARAKSRIRSALVLVNPVNVGAHANYNRAIELTRCDVVHFMNTDDWIGPHRFEALVAQYRKAVAQGVEDLFWGFGRVSLVDGQNKVIAGDGFWQYLTHVVEYAVLRLPSASFHLLRDNLAISTGNLFASNGLLRANGKFNNYKYVHDWDFVLRAILLSEPQILLQANAEYFYRHHPGNSFRKLGHVGHLESYEVLYRYFMNSILRVPRNRAALSPNNYSPELFKGFLAENAAHAQIVGRVVDYLP